MQRTWQSPDLAPHEGRFVTLQPLDVQRDANALFELSHGDSERESVWQFMPCGPFPSIAAMQDWLSQNLTTRSDALAFTVFSRESEMPIGTTSLLAIVPEHGRAEIGFVWFSPRVQRTKANTETQFLLLRHLFDEKNYRRVEWKCDARNAASRAAATRLGFSYEGRFRQHMMIRGVNRDTDWFAITDKEWPRLKTNFERWLYSEETLSLHQLNNG